MKRSISTLFLVATLFSSTMAFAAHLPLTCKAPNYFEEGADLIIKVYSEPGAEDPTLKVIDTRGFQMTSTMYVVRESGNTTTFQDDTITWVHSLAVNTDSKTAEYTGRDDESFKVNFHATGLTCTFGADSEQTE